MWSDQYNLKIQITARCDGAERIRRGDVADNKLMLLYMSGKRVVGAAGINESRDMKYAPRLIEAGTVVDPAKLADPAFNPKKAVGA